MSKILKSIEVFWWVKDDTQRKRITGSDIITDKHLTSELEHIAYSDSLDDFDKDDADFCLSQIADSGYSIENEGYADAAFLNFYGTINVTAINPIDYGVKKVKKIYKTKTR